MVNFESKYFHLKYEFDTLKSNFDQILETNKQIISKNKILLKENEEFKKTIIDLKLQIEKLTVKSNEPSSSKPDYLKPNSKPQNHKISGQKKGHKGISRKTPKTIDEERHYFAQDTCDKCGSSNLKLAKTRQKTITDLIFKLVNTKEYLYDKKCINCGNIIKAISPNGDSQSPYGKNAKSLFAYLRSKCGLTLRPAEVLFTHYFGLKITDSTISNNEIKMSKLSKQKYHFYLEIIKNSTFSHKDETSFRIKGKTHWIWIYDNLSTVFYRLSDNRGKKTLISDFGNNPNQISINDCYGAYNLFKNQQICWAHIIRECEAHSRKIDASKNEKIFYKKIKKLFHLAKTYIQKQESLMKRKKKKALFESRLMNIMISIRKKTDFLRRMFKRLNKYIESTFLFVQFLELNPTNNLAERGLRPFVIHRKASFGSQSEEGGQAKVILKTVFENAKREGKLFSEALDFVFEKKKKNILLKK